MRVLVTRPEPGATATAEILRTGGHAPLVLPLSRTSRLAPPVGAELGLPPDAVVGTSANGFRHAQRELAAHFGHLPCFAVGERTAAAAAEAGFSHVRSASGDARSLMAMIGAELPARARLLYLCGTLRRPFLEASLTELGFRVTILETYRTDPIDYAPAELDARLGKEPVGAALIYSPFGAERYSRLAAAAHVTPLLRTARVLCLSGQIAEGLAEPQRHRAEIADRPEEASLLALLERGV